MARKNIYDWQIFLTELKLLFLKNSPQLKNILHVSFFCLTNYILATMLSILCYSACTGYDLQSLQAILACQNIWKSVKNIKSIKSIVINNKINIETIKSINTITC